MAVQLQKLNVPLQKTEVSTVTKTALQERIDRLGEIEEILKEVKPLVAEKEALRKALIAETADFNDTEEAVLEGLDYTAVFSPCAKTRKIANVEGYFEAVGEEIFLKTVNIPITEAEKYLSPSQQKDLINTTSGSRTLKAVVRRA